MGGTKDSKIIGKKIKENFKDSFIVYTSITSYGGELAKDFADLIIDKPLDLEGLKKALKENKINILLDSTHPFAINASKNAILACQELNIKYIRFERKIEKIEHRDVLYFKDFDEALKEAKKYNRVFYTAGIKNLEKVVDALGRDKVVARVLPISVGEALKLLPQKNIVAMYGTFSKELNKYLIKDYGCDAIITKESGDFGGFKEKVLGAIEAKAKVLVIERPKIRYPIYFNGINELIKYLKTIF